MDIGTIETIDDAEEPKKRRVGRLGGSNAPGGNGGGHDGGDGGDDAGDRPADRTQPFNEQKSRVFTFFLLIAIVMTFGGVIAAYVVIQANKAAEWRPFDLPIQVWISTAIIIVSSITYEAAKRALMLNRHRAAKKWLIVTSALGAAFISSQVLAWLALAARGMYLRGNPYAGFFYVLTALHAVHVLGGVIALGSILLRSWHPAVHEEAVFQRLALARVVGWYWHFMGGLWLVLFVLLGFWK
jgi:cytochrome c oxidase subunit III